MDASLAFNIRDVM